MDYSRAVMKQEVKQAMKQTRPHPMLTTLLYLVFLAAVSWAISWGMNTLFSGGTDIPADELLNGIIAEGPDYLLNHFPPELLARMVAQSMLVSAVISILTTIWNGLMSVGYAGYCLDMTRGANPQLGRLFSGFSRAGSAIPAYILVAVFTFLWVMLFAVVYGVVTGILSVIAYSVSSSIVSLLISLLMLAATAGYAIAVIWVVFRYAMVPYIIIDNQSPMSALDAIRTSKALMEGRKGSYFVLQLSFIGWYLLEYLVAAAGVVIAVIASLGTASAYIDQVEEMMSYIDDYGYEILLFMVANDYYDITWLTDMLSQIAFFLLPITLLCGAAIFVINLWLTPYRTGSNARFYLYAKGGQPDFYGNQPSLSGPYGGQPGPYDSRPGPYGGQPGPYDSQPGPYGGQPGPYSGGPYGYTPPGQSPFGGYAQTPQPPQYGAGTYPQWGAPQAPAAPAAPVVPDVPAAPAAPAASDVPVIPATTVIPETTVVPEPFVPTRLAEPIVEAPFEEPCAGPEAPNDDTPQRPSGPIYPQY